MIIFLFKYACNHAVSYFKYEMQLQKMNQISNTKTDHEFLPPSSVMMLRSRLCIEEDTSKLHNVGLCCLAGLCLPDLVLLHMLERDGRHGVHKKKKKKSILYLCTDYPGLEFEFTAVSMFFKLFTTTVTGRMCWSLQ